MTCLRKRKPPTTKLCLTQETKKCLSNHPHPKQSSVKCGTRKIICLCCFLPLILLMGGCKIYELQSPNQKPSGWKDKSQIQASTPENAELLKQLSSPNFFEHTQAARRLVEMGDFAIPDLIRNKDLIRRSDESNVSVALLIIKIIFQKQELGWVVAKLQSNIPEIHKIASDELERRAQEEK